LLELLELPRRGGFACRAIHVRLEQLVLQIETGPRAAGALHIAPRPFRAAVALHRRSVALRALELRLHFIQLPLRQRELLALRDEFDEMQAQLKSAER